MAEAGKGGAEGKQRHQDAACEYPSCSWTLFPNVLFDFAAIIISPFMRMMFLTFDGSLHVFLLNGLAYDNGLA